MDPKIERALTETVQDSMGIYCASVIGADGKETKRTEWQDGWNAYGIELSDRKIKAEKWFESLGDRKDRISEMLVAEAVFLQFGKGGTIKAFFLTSDLFAWGYANWDEVTDDLLEPLYQAWKKNGTEGMLVYWCKHENLRPQRPVEKQWRESGLWDEELELLPSNNSWKIT